MVHPRCTCRSARRGKWDLLCVTPVLLIPLPPSPRPSGIWAVGPCLFSRLTLKGCFLFPCRFVARWPIQVHPHPSAPRAHWLNRLWEAKNKPRPGAPPAVSRQEDRVHSAPQSNVLPQPGSHPGGPHDDCGSSFQHYPGPGSSSLGEQTKGRGKKSQEAQIQGQIQQASC